MPPPPNYRKRRPPQGPSKNELKVSRNESQEAQKARAGTLRERFPNVHRLHLEYRMETDAGAVLEQSSRDIGPEEALLLDVECQGGCGNGKFLLTEAIESLLQAGMENKEGMGLCQASSYKDPKLPCGTKLYYHFTAQY
jgi:hypothetical protein